MNPGDILQGLALLYQYGKVPVLFLVILWLLKVVMDEDRSSLWRSRIYHGLYKLSGRRDLEKKYISNDINAHINLARRDLHHGSETLPKSLSVEWVQNHEGSTYTVKEGDFIVRLDPSAGQQRNIAKLAIAVVVRTSLLGIRHLIEEPLEKAFDLNLARNILQEVGDKAALDWFLQNEFLPTAEQSGVKDWNSEVMQIDERGVFTRILLVELEAFSKRIAGLPPRPFMMGEIEQLVHFLFRIATKQAGKDVPLAFVKAYIAIGILLVAKTDKILKQGVEPYVKAFNYSVQDQLNAVYVLVYDKDVLEDSDAQRLFAQRTKELDAEILHSSLVTKDFSVRYTCVDQLGKKRKAICTRYLIQKQD